MTPAARIAAAIELVEAIIERGAVADRTIHAYFKTRRYAGSGDRSAIADLVYTVLRHRASLGHGLNRADPGARLLCLAAARRLTGGSTETVAAALAAGGAYGPPPLEAAEAEALAAMDRPGPAPDWVRYDYPALLDMPLKARFGPRLAEVVEAFNRPAPLDLRVNTARASRAAVLAELQGAGYAAAAAPWSPLGIRLPVQRRLGGLAAHAEGRVEIQDEASQLVALACEPAPGLAVLDLCAGAGGKTLALAAALAGQGRLVATDIDPARRDRMVPRLARAGATDWVERPPLDAGFDGREAGRFDRVLVDAPCSLTGTWRRDPEARWRVDQTMLDRLAVEQGALLDRAVPLLRPGGRLVYATCSVLIEEDEAVVEAFLDRHGTFAPVDHDALFARVTGRAWPGPAARLGLLLDPACHRTDGFFVAVLEMIR